MLLPIDVKPADVQLVLCPDAVTGKHNRWIELVFAQKELTVCIQTILLKSLLKRLQFEKTLMMFGRMNVVKLIRCDVRCKDPSYYSIETKEQFEQLVADLKRV